MKNFINILLSSLLLFLSFIFLSCGLGHTISKQDYELGKQKTVTVGSPILTYISGSANPFDPNLFDKGTKEELVYSGKSGNTIKIDYRLYDGDQFHWYIKDGFTQHLEYDLSTSDMIAYKNYKIKVLDSNSSEIKFIVIEH